MTEMEFTLYRDERIKDLGRAYADSEDQSSDDPTLRAAWQRLRRNWQDHATAVKAYAYEQNTDQLMETWRSLVREDRFRNEHEGIALNPNLSHEQVAEIMAAAERKPDMYWVVHHLKQHPKENGSEMIAAGGGHAPYQEFNLDAESWADYACHGLAPEPARANMPRILDHFVQCGFRGCYFGLFHNIIKPYLDDIPTLQAFLCSDAIGEKGDFEKGPQGELIFYHLFQFLMNVESETIREYLRKAFPGFACRFEQNPFES